MIKKIRFILIRTLEEYSPISLLFIILPFFIPVEREMTRRLLLLFCAAPGLLAALINPKAFFKNPILLLMILFTGYFSAQHLRGMLPLNAHIVRMTLTTAVQIIGPVFILSRITPQRKLYPTVIRLILLAGAIRIGYELVHFYSSAPFPLARFAGMGHPVTGSSITGWMAVLAGAFFLQGNPSIKKWDLVPLITMPLFLSALLYAHTRSTALALLVASSSALIGIQLRAKKTLILFGVIAITFALYITSVTLAPTPEKRHKKPKPIATSLAEKEPTTEMQQTTPAPTKKRKRRGYSIREGGVLTTSEGGTKMIFARFYIWRDHLSRMSTPTHWVIGHGLGMAAFEKNVPDEKANRWYLPTEYGFQLHAHSCYIWALYHGGVIGLGILLLLTGTAVWNAFQAKRYGYIPFALILFTSIYLMANGQRLLISNGPFYLTFWVPIALAAGLKRGMKDETCKDECCGQI